MWLAKKPDPNVVDLHTSVENITKVSNKTRSFLLQTTLSFSATGSILMTIATFTNEWLYSAEVLKYYTWNLTEAEKEIPEYIRPAFFKNATFGPWRYCWQDQTPYDCYYIGLFSRIREDDDLGDASDSTTAVEISIRKTIFFLIPTVLTSLAGTFLTMMLLCKGIKYGKKVLVDGVVHVCAGILGLLTLVVYLSSVNQEVGHKISAASPIDDPLFYYEYGYSFLCLIFAYLAIEAASFVSLYAFMSKHDEEIYKKYQVRSVFKSDMMKLLQTVWNARHNEEPKSRKSKGARRTAHIRRSKTISSPEAGRENGGRIAKNVGKKIGDCFNFGKLSSLIEHEQNLGSITSLEEEEQYAQMAKELLQECSMLQQVDEDSNYTAKAKKSVTSIDLSSPTEGYLFNSRYSIPFSDSGILDDKSQFTDV